MVSFDGMRHDLIDRTPTPNFDRVAERGVRAAGLIPAYPSKTFPNHYSIATGLYPAHHGIVDNVFYDPAMDAVYRLGDSAVVRDGAWYGGEPIWVTAEKQGVRTASFYWVGSEAPVQGVHPSYFRYYDDDFPFEARVDTVLHWLSLPVAERPQLVTLYFSEPDHVLHVEGPDDATVDSVVRRLDGVLGRLLDGLDRLPIADSLYLVIVSDHGMAGVPTDHVIRLDDAADLDGVRVINNTTQAFLYFDGHEERMWAVYEALRDRLPNGVVYLRDETPAEWRYRDNDRIGDLVIAAEPGWVIRTAGQRPWSGGGMHGWDPAFRPMHGTFMAMGPAIEPGRRIPAFRNVHIYPLVANLLGLEAAKTDGRLEVLAPILRSPVPSR
jgi:predicted AlkP superfamily pyrophosphatase or phosphodiesterase